MQRNKGVTLISLIITVIIMLILVSVGVAYGMETYRNSKINQFVAQLQMIQKSVDNYVEELKFLKSEERPAKIQSDMGAPRNLNNIEKIIINELRDAGEIKGNSSDFKYFTAAAIKEHFQLENIKETNEFAINFITREVVSLTGEEYKGIRYYTQYNSDLPNGQGVIIYDEDTLWQNLSFEYEVQCFGLTVDIVIEDITASGKLISNAVVSYRQTNISNAKWVIVENHTSEGKKCKIPITKSATYEVKVSKTEIIKVTLHNSPKLKDNLSAIRHNNTSVNSVEIEKGLWYNYSGTSRTSKVPGTPGPSENWAFATKNSKVYVWIPRLAYNTSNSEIKFMKGNTKIPTDGEDVTITSTSLWRLPAQFVSGSDQYSGIWVEVKSTDNRTNLPGFKNIFTDASFFVGREIIGVI